MGTVRENCSYCGGSGKITCNSCGGSGSYNFDNSGSCGNCGGSGKTMCTSCYGKGYKEREVSDSSSSSSYDSSSSSSSYTPSTPGRSSGPDAEAKMKNEADGYRMAKNYDKAISLYNQIIEKGGRFKSVALLYRAVCYYHTSYQKGTIDDITEALNLGGFSDAMKSAAFYLRAWAYGIKGKDDESKSDFKQSADLALGNQEQVGLFLAEWRIPYKPNSGSSSSSSSSSKNENPVVRFFQAIGFEDIDYFGLEINIPVSILLSLVITACITFLAYLFIPQKMVIVGIVSLVLSFLAFACTHKALRVILIIIAAIGLAFGVYTFVSPSKSKLATTQSQTATATATVNANVNFRTEPTTGDNIIRQLQQGDTVTLTGETNGGWTQIKHGSDTGWISTEYLKK